MAIVFVVTIILALQTIVTKKNKADVAVEKLETVNENSFCVM